MKLTKEQVLLAIPRAAAVRAGAKGHPPTAALVLRRLKQLAQDGLVTQSKYTNGNYGYRWDITEAGRRAIEGLK